MHIFRNTPPSFSHGSVVTIGNFDGVHIGHQHVLNRLCESAQLLHLPSVVVTFEPQPEEQFSAESSAPFRLTSCREKAIQFQKLGIEYLMIVRFSTSVSQWEPEFFVRHILIDQLRTKQLILGDGFYFGKDRKGDMGLLQTLGDTFNFEVEQVKRIDDPDKNVSREQRVSSTWIRQLLLEGRLSKVRELLGRHYSIWIRLQNTKNPLTSFVDLQRRKLPFQGTYLVSIHDPLNRVAYGSLDFDTLSAISPTQKVIRWLQPAKLAREGYVEIKFLRQFADEASLKASSEFQTLMTLGHL